MTDAVRLILDGEVAIITLARAEKLNALDGAMIAALADAAARIDGETGIRAAILTGEGKGFCAGGDIAAWGELPALEMWRSWTRSGHRAFDALARLRVPLIAALNGHALGGGLELAGTADIRIAERQAKFGLPETGIAMVPGWSGTQRLVRRFGSQVIRRLALTGEIVTAERALALGLVDEVVETGHALAGPERSPRRSPRAGRWQPPSPSSSSTQPRARATPPPRSKAWRARWQGLPMMAPKASPVSAASGRPPIGTGERHDVPGAPVPLCRNGKRPYLGVGGAIPTTAFTAVHGSPATTGAGEPRSRKRRRTNPASRPFGRIYS